MIKSLIYFFIITSTLFYIIYKLDTMKRRNFYNIFKRKSAIRKVIENANIPQDLKSKAIRDIELMETLPRYALKTNFQFNETDLMSCFSYSDSKLGVKFWWEIERLLS